MPAGRQHTALNLGVFAVAGGALMWAGVPWWPLFVVGGGVSTLFASPDVDLAGKGSSQTVNAWGPFRFVWLPMGAMTRHRGVTHTYVRGPLIVLAYLAAVLATPVLGVLSLTGAATLGGVGAQLTAAWPFLAGFVVAHWLHLMADQVRFKL